MKKNLIITTAVLSVVFILSSCFMRDGADNTDILYCLEKPDTEVVDYKGYGDAQTYQRDGNTYVISRSFEEEIFGLPCKTQYMYSDNQVVSQIITEFIDVERDKIMLTVENELGEPDTMQPQTEDTQFKAVWQAEMFTYTLIQQPASPIYMIIERQ